MIVFYIILSVVCGISLFCFRSKTLNRLFVVSFIVLQWIITVYLYTHRGTTDSVYFTADSLALIFLIILSVICIPAFYHGFIFLNSNEDKPRERAIYLASMLALIVSLTLAYLANHIGITWVFVELTTLSASALIYHRRNARTLEATWKYVFVCSISITLVFIGILFLGIAIQGQGFSGLSYAALFEKANAFNVFWLKLSFLFIFSGFTAKAGLVPMYTAGIDAKDKAPSSAGALLATVLINVGFIGIFRFYSITSQTAIFH